MSRSRRIYGWFLVMGVAGIGAMWLLPGRAFIVGSAAPADLARADPGFSSDAFEPFVFLHFGDPQLGRIDLGEERRRFAQAVQDANDLKPAFVIIAGDLTEDATYRQTFAFRRALGRLREPVMLVPGNHDIFDARSRRVYRSDFGPDWYATVYRNCLFLCLNSELPYDGGFREEAEAQAAFAERVLAQAAADRTHRFIVQHRPPLSRSGHELRSTPEPLDAWSARILALARQYGVRTFLCGHWHTTEELTTADGSITAYVVSGTAEVRSRSGRDDYRYRVFRVYEDRIEQTALRLDAPMTEKRATCTLQRREAVQISG